ncbi:hypothetical protein [Altererythrobacter sp. MF3-039]|uniref:hypothetical protein n=1 Tax=Altererythrobacter sp. MF3-039 TaxID=3252901 RepID=UPI00390CB442
MSALAFAALARASQTGTGGTGLFADLAQQKFPATVRIVYSSGYEQFGLGAGSYIADSLANPQLVLDHPRFAFTDAGGRSFRLFAPDGSIAVEQGGAKGSADINDQPSIQAAIDYAAAVGIETVEFAQPHYELWATLRSSAAGDPNASDGHYLVIGSTLTLRGSAAQRTTLDCRSTTGRNMEDNWQDVGGAAWRGNGIFVKGDLGPSAPTNLSIDYLGLERLIFRGNAERTGNYTYPVDPVTGDGWDFSHKGFRIQDSFVGDIALTDTDFIGWKGEMFYIVGYSPRSIRAERCRMVTGNGNAWNVQADAPATIVDCEFGDCYQAAEALSQANATYRNVTFRDCDRIWMVGGRNPLPGFHYRWPNRDTSAAGPICRLEGCELRNVGQALIGSYVQGSLTTIDSQILLDCATLWAIEDCRLEIDAWLDQGSWVVPLAVNGPATLNTPVPTSPVGTFQQAVRNSHMTLRCHRTAEAAANDRHWAGPQWNGHLESNCSITVEFGEQSVDNPVRTADNPPVSFPLIVHDQVVTTQLFGASSSLWHGSVAASGIFTPRAALCATGVDDEATYDLHLPTAPTSGASFGYGEGQVIRIYKRGDAGALRFVRGSDPSFVVRQTRVLDANFDWIEFRWNNHGNRWEEHGFWTSAAV